MASKVLLALTRGAWLIDPRAIDAYTSRVVKVLAGDYDDDDDDFENKKIELKVVSSYGVQKTVESFDQAEQGSISVLNISGAIMKNNYCGDFGTKSFGEVLKAAEAHPNISGHILQIDSPGGSVDGTGEFADIIANAKKPLVVYVDGLAASAGYWIASGAKHIMASHKTAEIGSIGTAMTIYDQAKRYEEYGIKVHNLRASKSSDKNETYFQVLKDNYAPMVSQILDPTNEIFLSSVKNNRSGKLNLEQHNVLTGKVYLAEEAITNGLIDSIGTFEEAVNIATSMAQQIEISTKNQNNINMKKVSFLATLTALGAFFGVKAKEGEERIEAEITDAQFEAINAAITENATLKTQLQEAQNSVTSLTSERDTLKTSTNNLTTEVNEWKEKYNKVAPPTTTTTTTGGEGQGEGGTKNAFETSADVELAAAKKELGL